MNTVKVRNLELGNGIPAICIPNVGKTKEDILSLTRTYLGMHMDLMEWRMDWYEDVEDIAKVTELVKELRNVMGDTPLLCTFRTDKEGGVHPMSTEKYAELNKAVAATGNADIIDVEIFTGDDIVREMIDAIHASGAKVIASNHDFDKTPAKSDLIYRLRKMQDMGADIPKMAVMPQTKKDVLTLQIKAGGPLQGITVTADSQGNVKGYVGNPDVCIPANSKGKLDVAGAVGPGFLTVIKDMGLKEPYSGQVMLQTCEIAEDLTYYFATSEQVPSAVGLGVLMNKNNTVRQAGGFIVQLMPFAEDALIDELEKRLKGFSFTALLKQGMSVEAIIRKLFEGYDVELTDSMPCAYVCDCSKERVEQAVISLGRKELGAMIADNKPIEVVCDFCHTKYTFSPDELLNILKNK